MAVYHGSQDLPWHRRLVGDQQASTTTVQWFTPDGKVARERTGPNVTAHHGFVSELEDGTGIIHAVKGDWKITLPQKTGPAGYITGTEDSRTFVHEFHSQEGEIAADVYVDGKLAGTIGPFFQYQGQNVQLGDDGSVAFLVWKDENKKVVQVVVAGPTATVRFRVDCEGPVTSPIPALDGAGILVHTNASGQARNTFTFYSKAGKVSSQNVGPNAGFLILLCPSSPLIKASRGQAVTLAPVIEHTSEFRHLRGQRGMGQQIVVPARAIALMDTNPKCQRG